MRKDLILILTWVSFILILAGASMSDASTRSLNTILEGRSQRWQELYLSALLHSVGESCNVMHVYENGSIRGEMYVSVLCRDAKAFIFNTSILPPVAYECGDFEQATEGRLKCFKRFPADERNSC